MKLGRFDVLKILGYTISITALLTPDILSQLGFSNHWASLISTVAGRVLLGATLIASVLRNPSPAPGTVSAVIPVGSVPVVTAAPGTGSASVAVADPKVVLGLTSATIAPPKQISE